jgi:hypothetical protein
MTDMFLMLFFLSCVRQQQTAGGMRAGGPCAEAASSPASCSLTISFLISSIVNLTILAGCGCLWHQLRGGDEVGRRLR